MSSKYSPVQRLALWQELEGSKFSWFFSQCRSHRAESDWRVRWCCPGCRDTSPGWRTQRGCPDQADPSQGRNHPQTIQSTIGDQQIYFSTRRNVLGSDGMTKSDCSCSLCALSVLCECLLSALWMLEVILKSSWSHHEEFKAKRWRLCALDKLSSDRQTDGHWYFLSSRRSQKCEFNTK